eukprot:6799240-Prymnesium_polylepis.2
MNAQDRAFERLICLTEQFEEPFRWQQLARRRRRCILMCFMAARPKDHRIVPKLWRGKHGLPRYLRVPGAQVSHTRAEDDDDVDPLVIRG